MAEFCVAGGVYDGDGANQAFECYRTTTAESTEDSEGDSEGDWNWDHAECA